MKSEMQAVHIIQQTRAYLDYLEKHVRNVQRAWCEVQEKCKDMDIIYDDHLFHWLNLEVEHHDCSKLTKEEFTQYRALFFPVNDVEKQMKDLGSAWVCHKDSNKHHWQTWTAADYTNPKEWCVHCTHMVLDWMATGYTLHNTAQAYYEDNKEYIQLPYYAVDFIYEIFKRIYPEENT